MPGKIIKEYFSFTKKERIGVITLVIVIITVFIIPYLLPEKKERINRADWEQFKRQSALLIKAEKNKKTFSAAEQKPGWYAYGLRADPPNDAASFKRFGSRKPELFYFDPNTLAEKEWEKLGLRSKTISTIQNYLLKGGRFRRSEDLGKIYGLQNKELERLIPYVKINTPTTEGKKQTNEQFHGNYSYHSPPVKFHPAPVTILDINTADTTQLIALPGIGSKLAARIISFREKLGAFHTVDQLSEVYGLPDSTFQRLRPRLMVSDKALKRLNVNSADANELRQLPYLQWNMANAIVQFRNRHGDFKNLEELLQIDIFTPELLKKISPYLTIQ